MNNSITNLPKALNYANGPMGRALNEEIRKAWRDYRADCRMAWSYEHQYGKSHPRADGWIRQSKARLLPLLAVRKVGRLAK